VRHKLSKQLTTHRRSSNFYKLAQNLAVHVVSLSYAVGLHSTHRHRPKEFTSIQRRYFVYSQAIGLMAYHFLSRVNSRSCMQHAILFYQFCLSLRLSVCPMPVLFCVKTKGHIGTLFHMVRASTFSIPTAVTKFQGEALQWGRWIQGGGIFFANIAVYLWNGIYEIRP